MGVALVPTHGLQTLSDGAPASCRLGASYGAALWGRGCYRPDLPMHLLTLFSSFGTTLTMGCSSAPRHSSVCVTPALQQLPRLPGMTRHHLQHPEQVCGMTDLLRKQRARSFEVNDL